MGISTSKSFTELGITRLYQYFIVNILVFILSFISLFALLIPILFQDIYRSGFLFTSVIASVYFLLATISIWIVFEGYIKISLFLVALILYILAFFISFFSIVLFFLVVLILLYLLVFGLVYIFIGRNEFGKKHRIFVIIGFILSIVYFILYIINLFLTSFIGNIALSSYLFIDSSFPFIDYILIIILIEVILNVFSVLAFSLFIYNLTDKKIILVIAFILGLLGPITFGITSIITMVLFLLIYRNVTINLEIETKKPELMVPCPFCGKEIPANSKSCRFCGTEFKVNPEFKKINNL